MINESALEPLFDPWDEPSLYRYKPEGGDPEIRAGRRRSNCLLVPYIRQQVGNWRRSGYIGASDTTRTLLNHWFNTEHPNGFRYHFGQREAAETIIWLYEVQRYRLPSEMYSSLLPDDHGSLQALSNLPPDSDAWANYCCKLATGGGKTKVMSLLVAWSYFHSLLEVESELPRHFLLIAPNLIVFDRLCSDFENKKIFTEDPVIPGEWAGMFNLQVVLQDQSGSGAFDGTLYLTNIHRLFDKREEKDETETVLTWGAPEVRRQQVFRTGKALRKRISEHPRVLVLNDEAHHLHDPDSAWNEALRSLHHQSVTAGNAGILGQFDFTATPRHNNGDLFKNIVSDFPLGEAVDAGIVKTPVIGKSSEIKENEAADNAYDRFRTHLLLGYAQYEYAYLEWQGSHKPILFVMTENAQSANEIAQILNEDPNGKFPLLKGKVLNLHTRLKGKIVKRGRRGREFFEFIPDESGKIKDEDLKMLRRWSSELDSPDSPYRCVVSVLMLREGWDVRNVTTIVPLRPFSAKSNILPEQTLGRGLRRMTGPGRIAERVTVVEHPAFTEFYKTELALEGLDPAIIDLNGHKPETVTVFVDFARKDVTDLEIELPQVSDSIRLIPIIEGLEFEDVRQQFESNYKPLPVGKSRSGTISFVEKTLFTEEVVREYDIDRGLLAMGQTASSVFVRVLEKACKVQNSNAVLNPLIQRFIEEVLFERKVSLFSGEIDHRLADGDVRQHIEATFAPLIRAKTQTKSDRKLVNVSSKLSRWSNFQVTMSARHPCEVARKTMFNLVACDREFEAEFAGFLDRSDDVAAFAKNAGPQKLSIDYLNSAGRPALYWPDFFVRSTDGLYYLVETKGAEDANVAPKAAAAVEWCKSASKAGVKWEYVFVSQPLFDQNNEFSIEAIARCCAPKLKSLLDSLTKGQMLLPVDQTAEETLQKKTAELLGDVDIRPLPDKVKAALRYSVSLLDFTKKSGQNDFAAAFQPLLSPLEEMCSILLRFCIEPFLPAEQTERETYFAPFLGDLPRKLELELNRQQYNLIGNVIHGANRNRLGNLLFCLGFPRDVRRQRLDVGGVWKDVPKAFGGAELDDAYEALGRMNDFRNKYVAHGEEQVTDYDAAKAAMVQWARDLSAVARATIQKVGRAAKQ